MKGMRTLLSVINNNTPTEKNINNDESKIHFNPAKPQKIIGDIDELIFPDDEPYYISER